MQETIDASLGYRSVIHFFHAERQISQVLIDYPSYEQAVRSLSDWMADYGGRFGFERSVDGRHVEWQAESGEVLIVLDRMTERDM